jgi:Arc/MetJ family transcription regulator
MYMKRTNIVINEELIKEAMRVSGLKTIKGIVDTALRDYIRREKQLDILKLKGAIKWEGDLTLLRETR